jgi:hypothetical protein
MMKVTPYESLKTTTITSVVKIDGAVDPAVAFQLIPITRVEIKQKRNATKCKLPHLKDQPGAVLSARYRKHTRGVVKNKKNPFKNSVTIDMCLREKNVGLKLSKNTIHICGCKHKAHSEETTELIFGHLKKIQRMLNILHKTETSLQTTMNFVKEVTKGKDIQKVKTRLVIGKNVTVEVFTRTIEQEIINIPPLFIPEGINKDVVEFLLSFCDEFLYHSDYCTKLNYISRIKHVYKEKLSMVNYSEAMVNYNYSLGYKINRELLGECIASKNGFYSRHNNELSNSVTIELPYHPKDDYIKKKKNKVPHHSFLVYKSGSVTQSGPNTNEMKDVYYLFMKTIHDIKDTIKQT